MQDLDWSKDKLFRVELIDIDEVGRTPKSVVAAYGTIGTRHMRVVMQWEREVLGGYRPSYKVEHYVPCAPMLDIDKWGWCEDTSVRVSKIPWWNTAKARASKLLEELRSAVTLSGRREMDALKYLKLCAFLAERRVERVKSKIVLRLTGLENEPDLDAIATHFDALRRAEDALNERQKEYIRLASMLRHHWDSWELEDPDLVLRWDNPELPVLGELTT